VEEEEEDDSILETRATFKWKCKELLARGPHKTQIGSTDFTDTSASEITKS
jgi:hypothetical protein